MPRCTVLIPVQMRPMAACLTRLGDALPPTGSEVCPWPGLPSSLSGARPRSYIPGLQPQALRVGGVIPSRRYYAPLLAGPIGPGPSGLPRKFAPRRIPLGEENREDGPQAERQSQGTRRDGARQRP